MSLSAKPAGTVDCLREICYESHDSKYNNTQVPTCEACKHIVVCNNSIGILGHKRSLQMTAKSLN